MNTDHITQYAKRARHPSVVPFVAPLQESRGQNSAAERSWGETPSIRHDAHMDPPPLVIPWQVVIALVFLCIGLAGYAVQFFSK